MKPETLHTHAISDTGEAIQNFSIRLFLTFAIIFVILTAVGFLQGNELMWQLGSFGLAFSLFMAFMAFMWDAKGFADD